MHEPGQELRKIRERLGLKYRDVQQASARIAAERNNDQFIVGLSRLADIENKATVPSIYRLYSLCAIYRLDFNIALAWYGVKVEELLWDAVSVRLNCTNVIDVEPPESLLIPFVNSTEFSPDYSQTFYLNSGNWRWGKLPAALLKTLDVKFQRYAFIGLSDWFMHPLIRPGSFVQIDEEKRKLTTRGWTNEWERPIYLVEHRKGFRCGWCSIRSGDLVVQPHPASQMDPEIYQYPEEIEVIGQVVGVAMRLDRAKRPHTRSATDQE